MTKARELSELGSYLNVSGGVASVNNITVSSNLEINVVVANGSVGTAGQMLTSNGSGVYWLSPQIGDITNVIAGTGLTGGGSSGEVTVSLATSGVVANTYGNSSSIPVITVDTYGRLTNVSTAAAAVVTNFTYTGANNTFSISTGDGSTFTANITAANATLAGVVTVLDSVVNTSILIAASANSVKNAYDRAIDANTRAASAQTAAISAYSNATSYADSTAATAYSNAVSVASTDATNKAANAYSNAVSYAATIAGTAYSNAVATAAGDATLKANNAYTTAVSTAASDATNKAANAYSNAVSYAATIAGTAYSNAVSTAAADATSKANNAYTTAVAAAASDATSKANNAYTTAVAAAASDATNKAANAYSNATTFASNASNISSGTLAEPRLPFRMNQDVRTTDTVEFGNMTVTGNLTVSGTTVTVNANNLVLQDNMIYLNDGSTTANPDLGIAGNYNDGTYRHAGFFRDASDGVWKVYDQYLPEPDATPYIDTSNASFRVADFQANVVTMASANVGGATINSTSYSGAANNASYLGTYAANNYPRKSEGAAITGAWDFSNTGIVWSGHSYTNTLDGSNVYLHIGQATSTDKVWNLRVYKADNSVTTFIFNSAGVATAENSYRAPLFYDINNTSYYVDPASTSYLNNSTFVGTVGIGTSSPGAKLETYQNIGGTNAIRMNTNFAGGNYVDLNPSITGVSNGGYSISLNGNIYQVISVDGNTGVGTTSPATKLHVGGGSLRIEHPGDRALDFIRSGASTFTIEHDTSRMYFYNASTANNIMSFSNASNVGIGVADADYKLDVRGIISSTVDVRAPIFYDSNNTGFYVDPATGSNLTGQVQITGGTAMTGGWNRTLYLAASFPSIVFNSGNSKYSGIAVDYTDANDGMRFWVNGSSADISGTGTIALRINTGNYIIANDVRAAIFYDTNNTGYFLDGSATSNIVNLTINGVLDVGASNPQYWRSPNLAYQRVDGRDDNTLYSRMHWYGVRSDGATSNFRHAWFDGSAYFGVDADTGFINFTRSGGGAVTSDGSFRAPIFYDSGDTNYYTDANSTSRFKRLILDNGDNLSWGAGYGAGVPTIAGSTNTALYFYPTGSTAGAAFTMYGSYAVVTGSMRAPMFYDSDNTAYYADPASFSNLSSILIGDSGNGYAYGAAATGKLYFGSIGADAGTHYHITTNMENVGGNYSKLDLRWYTGVRFYAHYAYGGVRFKEITTGNTIFSVGEGDLRVRAYDSMAAPVYYDYDNTAYYVNPNDTSVFNTAIEFSTTPNAGGGGRITRGVGSPYSLMTDFGSDNTGWRYGIAKNVNGTRTVYFYVQDNGGVGVPVQLQTAIVYDNDNTSYYADPNSTSQFNTIETRNGSGLRSFAGSSSSISSQIYFGNADNTRAWNWQVDENNRGALWSYDGSGWSKSLTIAHRGQGVYLRNNSGYDVLAFSASNYGYSAAYRTLVIGDQAYTTVCIGVDPGGNASGSFNGGGSGVEVMFKNGVNFITPNAANNSYHNPLTLADGYAASTGSFRAPIFYDQNNTAYYLDPASTTYINQLQILGGNPVYPAQWTTGYQSSSDFTDGTLVTTDIPATASAGDSFIIEITGKSYSATNLPFKVIAQGYLYNDTIINYTGASYAGTFSSYIKAFQDGGVLKFWWPRISYWNSFEVRVISMDGPTNNTITRNRVTSITNATEPTGTKKVQINLGTFMRADVTATNAEDLRAPIFYDSNNTGYYINPNGTSNIYQLTGAITYGSYGSFSASGTYGGYAGISFPDKSAALMIGDGVGTPSGFYFTNNTWGMYSYKGSVYTTVMYDLDDSSYRVDPTSTSVFNALTVGGVSVALGSYRNYGEQSFAPVGGSMTTAQFINDLNNKGLFNYRHAVAKASWSYAGNDDISDIGFNGCDLAGTVVETFVNADGTKTVWLTRPTTGAGNGSIYVWNDQGSGYSPGWRQVWTSGVSCYNGVDIRAPIFYDIDNTASYIDPAGTSRIGGEVRFGGGGNSSVITTDGDFYSRRASATNTGVYYFADGGNKYLYWDASRYYFGSQGPVDTDVSFRAPVFYDLNNTGYYLDPASTSSGNLAGYLYFANHGGGIVGNYSSYRYQLVYGMGDSYKGSLDGTSVAGGYGLWWSHPNAGGVASNLSNHGLMCIVNGQFFASLDASTRAITDMRSPIFYDLNNTGFYCDPNSYSSFYGVAIRGDQNATAAGNQLFLWDAGGTTTSAIGFKQVGGAWAEYGSTTGGYNTYFTMDTAGRGWVFRRSTNPGGDFSGTNVASITNTGIATFSDSVRTPIFYDSNDTGYYVNPNGASQMSSVYANDWFRPQGQSGLYFQDYGGGWHMTDTTWIRAYNGKAVYVSNEIAATGNITAYYSDERLKTRVGNIDDALNRVLRLDGFYYTENETARELGYNSDRQQVGVSAQQIQEVLPEAVYMAPVDIAVDEDGNKYSKTGENYLTVDYSRLVPLLIEAIKEQQLTITEQSAKINTLEAKLDLIIQKLEG